MAKPPRHIPTALGNTWVADVAPPQGGRYMAKKKKIAKPIRKPRKIIKSSGGITIVAKEVYIVC